MLITEKLEQLLKPVVEDMGCVLWGCEYFPKGNSSLFRVIIDKPTGVGIEDCERVSRQVNAVLEVEDPISGQYRLEVSSPGIPRPVFRLWHYKQFVGKEVKLKLFEPVQNKRTWVAVIEDVQGEDVILRDGDEILRLALSNITKANLTVE